MKHTVTKSTKTANTLAGRSMSRRVYPPARTANAKIDIDVQWLAGISVD
jgi:hypothetical protein